MRGSTRMETHDWRTLNSWRVELRRRHHFVLQVTDLAKRDPSIPRHPINRCEDVSPTEMRKGNNEIVQKAWTRAAQLVDDDLLCIHIGGRHGIGLRLVGEVLDRNYHSRVGGEATSAKVGFSCRIDPTRTVMDYTTEAKAWILSREVL